MKIILMRHGNALHGGPDSARTLSEKGVREAEAAGNFLRSINEIPGVILHSSLLRSKETAEHVEKALGATGLLRLHGRLKPEDSPRDFILEALIEFAEYDTIMAVGHEPFMSDLASLLLWRSRCRLSFDTGTLLEAESHNSEKEWNLSFYVQAKYLCGFSHGTDTPGDTTATRTIDKCPRCAGPLQHEVCGTSCRFCEWSPGFFISTPKY